MKWINVTCGGDVVVQHCFKIGDRLVCIYAENSQLGEHLKVGQAYTVAALSGWHGMDCVFLEGVPQFRQLASRFTLWDSSMAERRALNPDVEGSNPSPTA